MNSMYGFSGETKSKYDEKTMKLFSEVFNSLPIAAVIESQVIDIYYKRYLFAMAVFPLNLISLYQK